MSSWYTLTEDTESRLCGGVIDPALVLCGRNVSRGLPPPGIRLPGIFLSLLGPEPASIPLDTASALLRSMPLVSKLLFLDTGCAMVGLLFHPSLEPEDVEALFGLLSKLSFLAMRGSSLR
jgi:hypothetical protein